MKAGLTASTVVHAGIIVLTLVSFTGAKPFEPMPEDSLPVDVVSISDFTKLSKGAKTAPKMEKPQQVAEKVADPTPAEDPRLKVSDQPPVEATAPPPAPAPAPTPKIEPPPPTETPAKSEPAPAEAPKADTKKDEKPKDEAKAVPTPLPPRKPTPPPPKPVEAQQAPSREFNTDQIKELLDKRTPTRQVASASQVSTTASLGAPRGDGVTLSMSEIDAFRARMRQCWNTTGIPPEQRVFVDIRIDLKQDGTLQAEPVVMEGSPAPYGPVLARTAIAAIVRCQPFTMLRKETYAQWKSMDLTFRPQEFDR